MSKLPDDIKEEDSIFYVYRYIRLDTHTPFYIGKGKGNRAKNIRDHNEYCNNIANKCGHRIEFILENLTEECAFKKEKEFIRIYKSVGYCEANFTNGGEGPSGFKHTEETKKKMGRKGELHHLFGIGHTEETKKKQSEIKKGKYDGENNPFFGKTHSEGVANKLSQIHTGKRYSPRTEFKKGLIPHNRKQVIDIINGLIWDSAVEAANIYGINPRLLRNWLEYPKRNKTNLRYVETIIGKIS